MAGTSRKVDFNEVANRAGSIVEMQVRSPKHPEELASEIRERECEGQHRRRKDLIVLVAFLALVGGVAVVCVVVLLRADASTDARQWGWASALLSSIVSAAASFLAGKSLHLARFAWLPRTARAEPEIFG